MWMLPLLEEDMSTTSQEASTILAPLLSQPTQPTVLPTNLFLTHQQQCTMSSIQLAPTEMASNLNPTTNMDKLVKNHHQSLCLPPKIVLLQSIDNMQLRTFLGLTYTLISKHLPQATATMGHMLRTQHGVQLIQNQQT